MQKRVLMGQMDMTRVGGEGYTQMALSFERHLRARRLSEETIRGRLQAVWQLGAFLTERGMPLAVEYVTREHIEEWLVDLRSQGRSAWTLHDRFRQIGSFFSWLVEDGEIGESPLAHMKAPVVDDGPPDLLTADELRAMVQVCEKGKTFEHRRDAAILRLLADTGMRVGALLSIRADGLNWETNTVRVRTKGHGSGQSVYEAPFGTKTAAALDRYLRARGRHRQAALPALWLSGKGALTRHGVAWTLKRRAREAGVDPRRVHPHVTRGTFADMWFSAGGSLDDLMEIGNWRNVKTALRYAEAHRARRAREAHKDLSPSDRL